MTLSPEAERQIAEAKARNTAHLRGERPWYEDDDRARHIGAITEVGPGWEVWTCEDGRRNWHEEPLGGLVLHVDAGAPATVDEWGELHEHPAVFRVYDWLAPWDKAFRTVAEGEVNRQALRLADDRTRELAVRRFCREVGRSKRRSQLTAFECRLVTDAARLVAVLMMGGTK